MRKGERKTHRGAEKRKERGRDKGERERKHFQVKHKDIGYIFFV